MTHQYEPHDAPETMTRDFYLTAVVVAVAIVGAATILVAACCAVGWVIAVAPRLGV